MTATSSSPAGQGPSLGSGPHTAQSSLRGALAYLDRHRYLALSALLYLGGKEPMQDYDALSVKEILAGLEGADMKTLQKARVYERKFQRRPDVLEEVAAALRERRIGWR